MQKLIEILEKLYAVLIAGIFGSTSFYIFLNHEFHISRPAIILTGLALLISPIIAFRHRPKLVRADYLFLLLIVYLFLQGAFDRVPSSLQAIVMFTQYSIVPYILARLLPKKNFKYFFYSFITFMTILLISSFNEIMNFTELERLNDRPILFDFERQQGLSAILFGALLVTLTSLYDRIKDQKHVYLVFLLQIGLVSMITYLQSRGALLSALLSHLLICFLILSKISNWKKVISIISFVITIAVTMNMLPPNKVALYSELVQPNSYRVLPYEEESTIQIDSYGNIITGDTQWRSNKTFKICNSSGNAINIRIILLQEAWKIFKKNPILGSGLYGYRENLSCRTNYGVPHNLPWHILSELGFIGFFIFIFLFWNPLKALWFSLIYKRKNISLTGDNLTLVSLFLFYVINFQFAGCSYLEAIELYLLLGLSAHSKLEVS